MPLEARHFPLTRLSGVGVWRELCTYLQKISVCGLGLGDCVLCYALYTEFTKMLVYFVHWAREVDARVHVFGGTQ